ncbi:MAG: substrate-binding domain-containing protein [Chloroflexi bacterium]|nr:substrate-binding domain-containing protein [Chloroflexota bacterium]
MSPKLGRWTGVGVVVALILVTTALTTLVNQAFFAPTDAGAAAPPQVDSLPDSGHAEDDPRAVEAAADPIATEPSAPTAASGLTAAADATADSGESGIAMGAAGDEESDAMEPEPGSGEVALSVGTVDAGRSHPSHTESPEPAPTLCVVADGDPEKLYWKFVEFHAERAADIVGVHLDYATHPEAAARVQAIEECVRSGAPMILATLADPQEIVPAMRAAAELGVRIASFGAGAEHADDAGSLIHVSIDDAAAARRAADQFTSAGVSGAVLCLIPNGVEEARRHICDELRLTFTGGAVDAHQLAATDPGRQIEDLLAAAPQTAGLLVLEADLLPHAIEAMANAQIAPVLGSIGEFPLNKLPFDQRDQIAFTVMDLARFEILLAAAALRLMHTYHPNARFFEGAMIFEGQPNVHTGGPRGGHERPGSGAEPAPGSDGHDHSHDHVDGEGGEDHH